MLRRISSIAARPGPAVLAVVGAALLLAGVRALRAPAVRRGPDSVSPGTAPPGTAGPARRWPPEPVLGRPSPEDLARYARPARMPKFVAAVETAAAGRSPAARRPVVRRGVLAMSVGLVVFAAMAFEESVFHKDPVVSRTIQTEVGEDWECSESRRGNLEYLHGLDDRNETGSGALYIECDGIAPPLGPPVRVEDAGRPSEEPTVPSTPTEAAVAGCAPARAEPDVRPVGPAMRRAVGRQWRRIEGWLRENAPKTYRTLRKPASPRLVAAAEARMGVRFPDDLRASLLRHNGAAEPFGAGFGLLGGTALGARDILRKWRVNCAVFAGQGTPGDPRGGWWDGRHIPVASHENGDLVIVDSADGGIGFSDRVTGLRFGDGPPSYRALLKRTADALRDGGTVAGWRPVARNGALEWDHAAAG
ncbi:SMI1/KNR4 family protein [Spongiactinospora sp. TRM90649]|uniref:SMI1/KNR4 family protein n=1 Tax=Spongiactinospora sp. TRM90649 TaxID=3031114 RepID=UPI0023F96C9A|nr:SMI1/KNR4 family protein [Spongiactinospora sp. TRM90649]MDF5758515.1 SMI1/KNR4 family protein [Spongiactinospora sp. TRM90649]